jgi:hypothetical protein
MIMADMSKEENEKIQKLLERISDELSIEMKDLGWTAPGALNEFGRAMSRVQRTITYAFEEFHKIPVSN